MASARLLTRADLDVLPDPYPPRVHNFVTLVAGK